MAKGKKQGNGISISNYLTPDIVKIILYTILGIFIISAIKKVIDDLFNNPIAKGAGDVLGAAATIALSVLNGCSTQTTCSKIGNSSECTSKSDCVYSGSKCITTGGTEGSGGPFSLGCLLYLGIIVYIFAFIFGGIVKGFRGIFGNKTDLAKQAATLNGQTYEELSKDTVEKAKEDLPKVEEEFKTQNGREMTVKEREYSVVEVMKRTVSDVIKKCIDKITDSQKSAEETAKFQANLKEVEMTEMENSGDVDKDPVNEAIDRVPEIPKPI